CGDRSAKCDWHDRPGIDLSVESAGYLRIVEVRGAQQFGQAVDGALDHAGVGLVDPFGLRYQSQSLALPQWLSGVSGFVLPDAAAGHADLGRGAPDRLAEIVRLNRRSWSAPSVPAPHCQAPTRTVP